MLKKITSKEYLIVGLLVVFNLYGYIKYEGEIRKLEGTIDEMTV
jgi:hypothetical protein